MFRRGPGANKSRILTPLHASSSRERDTTSRRPIVAVVCPVERSFDASHRSKDIFVSMLCLTSHDMSDLKSLGRFARDPARVSPARGLDVSRAFRHRRASRCAKSAHRYKFKFGAVDKQNETYFGINVRLRYFVRLLVIRNYAMSIAKEASVWRSGEKREVGSPRTFESCASC